MCLRVCFEIDERIRKRYEAARNKIIEAERKKAEEEYAKCRAKMAEGMRSMFAKKMRENKVRYEAIRVKKLAV